MNRRQFFQVGTIGLGGFSLAGVSRVPGGTGRARACILLYMDGGPSHIDLWDLKPTAPSEIRGPFRPIATIVPGTSVCELLPMTARRMHLVTQIREDRPLRDALVEVAGQWPTYGYRRLTKQLQIEGHAVNAKRVRRLMHEVGIVGKAPQRKPRTTDSHHPYPRYPNLVEGLEVKRPDEVWVADITYIRLRKAFVYLAVLMDVFTRCIRGWHLGRGLDQELTLVALRRAYEHGRPEIHHSDQGVQYAATAYVAMLTGREVKISMASVGEPDDNGYAEPLMRTIKEE